MFILHVLADLGYGIKKNGSTDPNDDAFHGHPSGEVHQMLSLQTVFQSLLFKEKLIWMSCLMIPLIGREFHNTQEILRSETRLGEDI